MTNTVIVDSREKPSRIRHATQYFTEHNYDVSVKELTIGDYLFNDKCVFEYKTISDFISSVIDGRVFNQCINQSEAYPYHFCIIVGSNYDVKRALDYAPGFTVQQYLGAIARLNTYTTVINSTGGQANSFYQMMTQSEKCLDGRGKVKQYSHKSRNTAFNVLAYCIPRVSSTRAENICETLGLENIYDVAFLTTEQLQTVDGIGPKLASEIIHHIRGE